MNLTAVSTRFAYPTQFAERKSANKDNAAADTPTASTATDNKTDQQTKTATTRSEASASNGIALNEKQKQLVLQLKARDLEVRQHEAAHQAAAGGLATSGASFTYQRGPDGINYAIGGEVGIDVSAGRTPAETLAKAAIIQAAALAPAEPSGPDRAVAAKAQQMAAQARAELNAQASKPPSENANSPATASTTNGDPASIRNQRNLAQSYGQSDRNPDTKLISIFA